MSSDDPQGKRKAVSSRSRCDGRVLKLAAPRVHYQLAAHSREAAAQVFSGVRSAGLWPGHRFCCRPIWLPALSRLLACTTVQQHTCCQHSAQNAPADAAGRRPAGSTPRGLPQAVSVMLLVQAKAQGPCRWPRPEQAGLRRCSSPSATTIWLKRACCQCGWRHAPCERCVPGSARHPLSQTGH